VAPAAARTTPDLEAAWIGGIAGPQDLGPEETAGLEGPQRIDGGEGHRADDRVRLRALAQKSQESAETVGGIAAQVLETQQHTTRMAVEPLREPGVEIEEGRQTDPGMVQEVRERHRTRIVPQAESPPFARRGPEAEMHVERHEGVARVAHEQHHRALARRGRTDQLP
jgi:hypothetical protein